MALQENVLIKLLSTGGKKVLGELKNISKELTGILKKQEAVNKTALKLNKVRAATRGIKGTGLNISTQEDRLVSDKASAQTKKFTAALNKANAELNKYVRDLADGDKAQRLFTGSNRKVTTQVSSLQNRLNGLSRTNKEYTATLQAVLRGEQALFNQQNNRSVDELKQLTEPRLTKSGTVDKRYGENTSDLVRTTIEDLPNVANSIKGLTDYSNRLQFLKDRVDISSQSFRDLQAQIELVDSKLGKTKIEKVAQGPATKLDSLDAFRQKERFASELNRAEDKRLKLLSRINDSSLSEVTKQKLKNQLSQTDVNLQQKELELARANNTEVDRELSSLNKKQRLQRTEQLNLERNRRARKERVGRIIQSAGIGGGFPLLFGGGPVQAAAGLVGGGLGEALSPRGGFAGSIAATAIVSQLDAFAQKAREVGDALKKPSEALTSLADMGIIVNEIFQEEVNTLVAVGREAEALTMVNKELAKVIGTDGVEGLKELDTSFDEFEDALGKLRLQIMTDMVPAAITLIDLVKKFVDSVGGQRIRSKAQEMDQEAFTQARKTATEAAMAANENPNLLNLGGRVFNEKTKDVYFKTLTEESKKILQKELPGFLGVSTNQTTSVTNKGLGSEGITGIPIGEKNIELRENISLLERSFQIGSKAAEQEREATLILREQNKLKGENLKLEDTNILKLVQKRDQFKEHLELLDNMKTTIADGMVNAFDALIDKSKSLNDVLSSVVRQIGRAFLSAGMNNFVSGFNFGGTKLATGGYVNRPTNALVGEAGESEYVIPASKMSTAMQRYSSGVRGQSVIPGTGSSQSVGGGGGSTTVNYSGPILTFNSEEFVPKAAVGAIIASATSQGAAMGETRTIRAMQNRRSIRTRVGI